MFDKWFPGQDETVLEVKYCRRCGFACYAPRPEETDIVAKYKRLNELKQTGIINVSPTCRAEKMDQTRAKRLLTRALPYLPQRKLRILDYGGDDGKLMIPFVECGHECFLIDYNDSVLPEIRKIGNNHCDAIVDRPFDLVVCSHVLEHLADPLATMLWIRRNVAEDGVVYTEVPLEIQSGINRLMHDALTHVNFFTPNSLRALLVEAKFEVVKHDLAYSTYAQLVSDVVWAISRPCEGTGHTMDCEVDINKYLFPSLLYRLRKGLSLALLRISKCI